MPTLPMAPMPSSVFIENGQIVFGTPAAPDPTGANVTVNPGFPFFIPGYRRHARRIRHSISRLTVPVVFWTVDLPRHVDTGGRCLTRVTISMTGVKTSRP